jgi:HAMP domain-containing protein
MLTFLLQADTANGARRVFDVVGGFTDYILDYAIALAAVGALAMALLEAVKKLLDSRTRFHARRWTAWMMKSGESEVTEVSRREAYAQLIQLATGVTAGEAVRWANALSDSNGSLGLMNGWDRPPAHAVFTLETARMMAAIQDAGDTALASPIQYRALFDVITSGAAPGDITTWLARNGRAVPAGNDEVKAIADAFARLRQVFKRKLDAFQLYTEQRWATYNQFWANLLGAVIMAVALWKLKAEFNLDAPGIFALAIFGGILSPIAKDLVGALRRVRNG